MIQQNSIKLKAYAKINLALDVTGVRDNGYHDVSMVMQNIDIYDELEFSKQDEGISLSTGREDLPADNSNLIVKAANKFFEATGVSGGLNVILQKNIPMAAGLAGGSADAAATLIALNELYDTKLSEEGLCEIGVKIGADVPFCIIGGTVLAEGIGEILTKLSPAPEMKLVIVKPVTGISTKLVYDELADPKELDHPDVQGMIRAIEDKDISKICEKLGNVLESVTIRELPFIEDIKKEMLQYGADGTLMSGSGTTVFGIFTDDEKAEKAYKKFSSSDYGNQVFITKTYNI